MCIPVTSPVTVKSKTGCVCRNQPGGTKSTQPPSACRQSMFCSPIYLSSSYLTWSPSAAVPIEFVVAAAGRSTTPPSPCRGLLHTPSHAPGDLYSDPFSPMSPPRHRGPESQIADSLVLPLHHPHALSQEPLRLSPQCPTDLEAKRNELILRYRFVLHKPTQAPLVLTSSAGHRALEGTEGPSGRTAGGLPRLSHLGIYLPRSAPRVNGVGARSITSGHKDGTDSYFETFYRI